MWYQELLERAVNRHDPFSKTTLGRKILSLPIGLFYSVEDMLRLFK